MTRRNRGFVERTRALSFAVPRGTLKAAAFDLLVTKWKWNRLECENENRC